MVKKKYVFVLTGINLEDIDRQLQINYQQSTLPIPENTTSVEDIDQGRTPDIISFLDETKKKRSCTVSCIDLHNRFDHGQYCCFWDKNVIPPNIKPIGCPINFIPSKGVKKYYSELSKDEYTIREEITEQRQHELALRKENKITIDNNNFYETDGIFCSFNCVMAYINENKNKSIYNLSHTLLLHMYKDLNDEHVDHIVSAPHWRLLKSYGGHLTIEEFRESFNKIEYINHGIITQKSLGILFEHRIRL